MAGITAREGTGRTILLQILKWGIFLAFFLGRHVFVSPPRGCRKNAHSFFAAAIVPVNVSLQKAAPVILSSEAAVATGTTKKDVSSLPLTDNDTKDQVVSTASPTARPSSGDTVANPSILSSFLSVTSRFTPPRFVPGSSSFSSSSSSSDNGPSKQKNESAVMTCPTAARNSDKRAPLVQIFNWKDYQLKVYKNNTSSHNHHGRPLLSLLDTRSSASPSSLLTGSASPSAFSFLTPTSPLFPSTSVFPAAAAAPANTPLDPPSGTPSPSALYAVASAAATLSTSGISSFSAAASPAAGTPAGGSLAAGSSAAGTVAPQFAASSSSSKIPPISAPFATMALLAVGRTALRHTHDLKAPLTTQAANVPAASDISTAEESSFARSLPPSPIARFSQHSFSRKLHQRQHQRSSQQQHPSLQQQQRKLQHSHLRVLADIYPTHENGQREQQPDAHSLGIPASQHVKQQPHYREVGVIRFIGHSFLGENEPVKRFSAEEIATMPNCTFYSIYPGSCIPDSPQSPCKYCRAKQFHGGYGATQCPSAASFPEGFKSKYQWRMTPQGRRRIQWVMHEWVCIVEEIPAAVRASIRLQQQRAKAAAAAANAAFLSSAGGLGTRPALALQTGYASATSLPFMAYPSLGASSPQRRAIAAPGQGLRVALRSAATAATANRNVRATILFVMAVVAGLHCPLL